MAKSTIDEILDISNRLDVHIVQLPGRYHTVKRGDTLFNIVYREYGPHNLNKLDKMIDITAKINHLPSRYHIYESQELLLLSKESIQTIDERYDIYKVDFKILEEPSTPTRPFGTLKRENGPPPPGPAPGPPPPGPPAPK